MMTSNLGLGQPLSPFGRHRLRSVAVNWIAEQGCSHALTLVANFAITRSGLGDRFGKVCLDLDRACFGIKDVSKLPSRDRLFGIAFPEKMDVHPHLHAALRLEGWWRGTDAELQRTVYRSWMRMTKGAGDFDLQPMNLGWLRYSTKENRIKQGDYLLSLDYHSQR